MQLQVFCDWSQHVNDRPGWRQCLLRLVSCSLISIETRHGGACQWLMLPTFEMFYLSVFFFSEFPVEIKYIFSLIITEVNIYHHLLIKLRKRCYRYATALVKNFVATCPQAIFLHAVIFCILYCNFSIPQSLGIFTYIYSNQVFLRFLHPLQFL